MNNNFLTHSTFTNIKSLIKLYIHVYLVQIHFCSALWFLMTGMHPKVILVDSSSVKITLNICVFSFINRITFSFNHINLKSKLYISSIEARIIGKGICSKSCTPHIHFSWAQCFISVCSSLLYQSEALLYRGMHNFYLVAGNMFYFLN